MDLVNCRSIVGATLIHLVTVAGTYFFTYKHYLRQSDNPASQHIWYPDGITRGGATVSETHQCYAPIHRMRHCMLRCGNHVRSVR